MRFFIQKHRAPGRLVALALEIDVDLSDGGRFDIAGNGIVAHRGVLTFESVFHGFTPAKVRATQ